MMFLPERLDVQQNGNQQSAYGRAGGLLERVSHLRDSFVWGWSIPRPTQW